MMLIVRAALLVLGAGETFARVATGGKRQEGTVKYCPGSTTVCFSEFRTPTSNIIYRIAIPDVATAPFDILFQIVAPISTTGWAGLAWGGSMTNNPLTIGWANGGSAIASSRWATGHTLPQPYTGATYTVLPTSTTNTTHWQLDALCSGCSQWQGVSLNPNGPNTFAWAKGSRAVTTPSSNASTFAYHDDKGLFSHDLSLGRIPKGIFDAIAYDAANSGKPSSSSTAVPTSSPTTSITATAPPSSTPATSAPTVVTSVTTLPPRPSTTATSPTPILSTTVASPTTIVLTTTIIMTLPPTSTNSRTWTPGQTLTTITSTVVLPPSTITVVAPPWTTAFGPPPFGRPPFRGPPWRRPPVVEDDSLEGDD